MEEINLAKEKFLGCGEEKWDAGEERGWRLKARLYHLRARCRGNSLSIALSVESIAWTIVRVIDGIRKQSIMRFSY